MIKKILSQIQKDISNKWVRIRLGALLCMILIALIFFLPVVPQRCKTAYGDIEFIGDVGMPSSHEECYTIFHDDYWQDGELSPRGFQTIYHEVDASYNPTIPFWDSIRPIIFPRHTLSAEFRVTSIHPSYPADFSDNSILTGAAHNVFVGKVTMQTGTIDFIGHPATQFEVQIINNIKGNLEGSITVNQEGGIKNDILYLMDNSPLLQPGSTYLLSARYDPEGNFFTLNPHPNASKLLSTNPNLPDAALQALLDNDEKVRTLTAAYPNEKLLDTDIAHGNTRNAFTTLPPEAKAAAVVRADAARAALDGMSVRK